MTKWPRPATPTAERKRSPFTVTLGVTYDKLRDELKNVGAEGVVWIEAGFTLSDIRNDGLPYSSARRPDHPGVILYAPKTSKGPLRFVCDDYKLWDHNLRAIVLTMQRLRLADIYGVTKDSEQYKGFQALPPPASASASAKYSFSTTEDAARFMGLHALLPAASILQDRERWKYAYRVLSRLFHPDAGGNPELWQMLQESNAMLTKIHN
jgi:hypothetical protein